VSFLKNPFRISNVPRLKTRLKIVAFALFFILVNVFISNVMLVNWVRLIWADMQGYYQWLPSTIINHDPIHQPYAFFLPDGTPFNRYTYGVALLILPFFMLTHWYSLIFHLPATGYTAVYGFSMAISAITYCYLGLYMIYRFLVRYFDGKSVFISLIFLFLGTNLFFYTVGESGMSHVFSFFLFAMLLNKTPNFISKPSVSSTLGVAFPLAMAVLIRPTNLIMGLFLLLYSVHSLHDLKERMKFFTRHIHLVLIILLAGIIVWIPQVFYWHATTHDWIVWSYKYSFSGPETFKNWDNPKIFKVLFGLRSGWLMYSPILILSVIGLIILIIKNELHAWAILFIFILILYFDASWWAYTFPCGLGYRPLVEYYPILALPLALVVDKVYKLKRRWMFQVVLHLCLVLIFANIRMSFIYKVHPCWDGKRWTAKEYGMVWRRTFLLDDPMDYFPPYEDDMQ
jgi:hypothetical protein